ncbi:hypothetical protein ACP4OV_027309 [Aristida adscensionis]
MFLTLKIKVLKVLYDRLTSPRESSVWIYFCNNVTSRIYYVLYSAILYAYYTTITTIQVLVHLCSALRTAHILETNIGTSFSKLLELSCGKLGPGILGNIFDEIEKLGDGDAITGGDLYATWHVRSPRPVASRYMELETQGHAFSVKILAVMSLARHFQRNCGLRGLWGKRI